MNTGPRVTRNMTDEELVAAFVHGSNEAYSILVGKFKDPLVNFVYRMLGDYDGALDIVQDTFVRLHAKAGSYRPVAKFSTWIYTIAANLARSELRRRKWGLSGGRSRLTPQRDDPVLDAPDREALPDALAGRAQASGLIGDALAALPASFREAIVLFYLEDLPYEEICSILGIRMGTLKSRLSRARALLERSLRPLMEADDTF